MNFFDYQYCKQTAPVMDVTLEEHDRRYHPEGYEEGDVCSLRDTSNKQDLLSPETGGSDKASSLLKNWLPNVPIVEDESIEAMQSALTDDVRAFVKQRYYDDWKRMVNDFRTGRWSMATASGGKQYHTALPYIPTVLKKCFEAIGYNPSDLNYGGVQVSTMTVAKTTELSDEMQLLRKKGIPSPYISGVNVSNTHGIPLKNGWEELPLLLDAPIAVFRSNTEPRGILLICPIEDADPIKQIRIGNNKHGQYAAIAINGPELGRNGRALRGDITIGSFYGRSYGEFQQDLRDGLLLYVDKKRVKDVADQFGGLKLDKAADKTQRTSSFVENKLRRARGFVEALAPDYNHGVLKDKDFMFYALGVVIPDKWDYNELRRNGQFEAMRAILNAVAEKKGYKYNPKLDAYVKFDSQKGKLVKSAELQEWDGNGNPIPLEKRFDDNNSDRRYRIIHKGDEPIGWYNRTTGEVHLIKGKADAETVAHELGWHASFHYAEKNDPVLYNKMLEYAKAAPQSVVDTVKSVYGTDLNEKELLDEIGARRFTDEHLDAITNEIAKQEAKGWFSRIMDGVKKIWSGFVSKVGGNKIDISNFASLTPEGCMNELAKAMVEGKTLSLKKLGESRTN